MSDGRLGETGKLAVKLVRADGKELAHPSLGDLFARLEKGVDAAVIAAADFFQTALVALHLDAEGKVVDHTDTHEVLSDGSVHLGAGTVTNAGVNLMAWNDQGNVLGSTLSNLQYHAIGSGSTASAATDFNLQTAQGTTNLTGTTNGYMTGTQSLVAPNIFKSIATFTASGAVTVNEWILAMSNAAAFTGLTANASSATSIGVATTPFTTTGNGLKGWTVEINASAINTPTTTVMGLVTANTSSALTIANGWFTLANAGAATPSSTASFVVYPTAFDHKQFGTITMASGDTLQFTYQLTVASGG